MELLTPGVRNSLYARAFAITKDAGAADTIVADSITKCAQRVDPEKVPTKKLLAYLSMVVRNDSLSWYRKEVCRRRYLALHHDVTVRSAFSETAEREAAQLFEAAVAKIPEIFQQVMILRVVDQLTNKEVAEKLQIAQGTVMSRFFRGRQILLRWIDYLKAE
jgi:RNA polymerase sigma-70 factor (ECF subfamily)